MYERFSATTLPQAVAAAQGLDRAVLNDLVPPGSGREGSEVPVALRFRGRAFQALRSTHRPGDKIELTVQELEREGHSVARLGVISAFRNPNYNYTGGNTEGRAQLSRHMYGDAMDIYVDNGHGCMADLTGDGRVDVNDARVLARAAQKVEQTHPDLVGGIGVYAPTGAHCGFVHIDTRGFRARWGAW